MPSACLFCGTSGPGALTKEHVVPRWLIEYLQLPPDDLMFQGVADSLTGEIKKQRIHSSHNFVEGRICGDCNNGWGNFPYVSNLVSDRRYMIDGDLEPPLSLPIASKPDAGLLPDIGFE